jgi:hypothetical protein
MLFAYGFGKKTYALFLTGLGFRRRKLPVILLGDTTTFFWCKSVIAKLLWHDLR